MGYTYKGDKTDEALETFITETVMKKPLCSVLEPENCDVEERDDIIGIEKLTTEYLEKITSLGHPNPVKMMQQAKLKAGFENPFWVDASGIHQAYGYQSEEELFTSSRASIREQIEQIKRNEAIAAAEEDDDDMPFTSEL